MELIGVLIISFCAKFTYSAQCDVSSNMEPCEFKNTLDLPYIQTRHPTIPFSSQTENTKYCDLFALSVGQWYWTAYNMTNTVVDHRKCGTDDPIYLNGTIPLDSDGIVDRQACVRTFDKICEKTLRLKIKHCKYFVVYCFDELNTDCHSRFCFDIDLNKEVTTTTTTTTTTAKTTAATTRLTITDTPEIGETGSNKGGDRSAVIVLAAVLGLAVITVICMSIFIFNVTRLKAIKIANAGMEKIKQPM